MAGWGLLIPALAVLYVLNKRVNPRKGQSAVAIATMTFAFLAGCGLAFTFLGQWLAALVGLPGRFSQEIGIGFAVGVTLLMAGIMVADISCDKRADKGAQFAAIVTPTLLALVVGGFLGQTGGGAVRTVNSEVSSVMAQIGGS